MGGRYPLKVMIIVDIQEPPAYIPKIQKNGMIIMKKTDLGLICLVLVAGCGKEQPATYEVPKEQSVAPQQAAPSMGTMGSDAEMAAVQAAHASMSAHAPDTGFKAELPDGWTQKPASGMRMASYAIAGTAIDFYLTSLAMGDVPSNVNRWRGQVGLPDVSAEEIAGEVQTFEVEGRPVGYIEIYNEAGGKGIIAAIVDLSPKYWYFTAKGSVDELKANASDIRAFLESINLD